VFRYEKGHISSETATVGDLIEFLSQYPECMPVMAGWEGRVTRLGETEILHDYHRGLSADACDILLIDVEF
jgi:hypothetical protein